MFRDRLIKGVVRVLFVQESELERQAKARRARALLEDANGMSGMDRLYSLFPLKAS